MTMTHKWYTKQSPRLHALFMVSFKSKRLCAYEEETNDDFVGKISCFFIFYLFVQCSYRKNLKYASTFQRAHIL